MTNGKSLADLEKFLDWLYKKGIAPPAKVGLWGGAARTVFSILDEDEKKDVTEMNFDEVFSRFINIKGQKYTTDSQKSYRARAKMALTEFISYLKNGVNYKPGTASKISAKATGMTGDVKKTKKSEQAAANPSGDKIATESALPSPSIMDGVKIYTTISIPLKPGVTVLIQNLPSDFNKKQLGIITSFLKAYSELGGAAQ